MYNPFPWQKPNSVALHCKLHFYNWTPQFCPHFPCCVNHRTLVLRLVGITLDRHWLVYADSHISWISVRTAASLMPQQFSSRFRYWTYRKHRGYFDNATCNWIIWIFIYHGLYHGAACPKTHAITMVFGQNVFFFFVSATPCVGLLPGSTPWPAMAGRSLPISGVLLERLSPPPHSCDSTCRMETLHCYTQTLKDTTYI